MTGRGLALTGRGMDSKGPKVKITKEPEQAAVHCENSPAKKKRVPCDKSSTSKISDGFEATMTGANAEVNKIFSKYVEVMSERAKVDASQVRELEDIVKEVRALESHLMDKKEQLRRSLAHISDKLQ